MKRDIFFKSLSITFLYGLNLIIVYLALDRVKLNVVLGCIVMVLIGSLFKLIFNIKYYHFVFSLMLTYSLIWFIPKHNKTGLAALSELGKIYIPPFFLLLETIGFAIAIVVIKIHEEKANTFKDEIATEKKK